MRDCSASALFVCLLLLHSAAAMGNAKSSTKDAHESGWGADLSCVDCSTDANNERVQFVKLHRENERARHTKIDRVMESAETEMKWQEVTRTVRDNKQVLVPVARSPGKPSEDKSVWDEMCSEGGCGCGTEPHQYAAMMTSTTPDIEVSNSPTRDKVMDSFEKEAAWHEIRKTVSPPPQQRTAPMGRSSTMGHRAVHTPEQRGMGRQRGNHSNSPELLMLAHPELVRQASEPIHAQQHGHAQPARVSASAGVSPMNQPTVGRRTSEDYGPGMSQASQDFGPGMSQASVGRRNSQDFGPGIGLAQFGRRNPQDYGAGSPMPARPQSHVSPQPVSAPRRYHRPNPDVIQPALDAQSIREVEREQYRAWFDAKQGTTTHNTADSFEDLKRNHGHASSTLAVVRCHTISIIGCLFAILPIQCMTMRNAAGQHDQDQRAADPRPEGCEGEN